ncbi:AtpZ/AtpI family protein [uncultured Paraglaciecola sp.]|uniref:AtpZ/AtpI family protein n=1 Tax=uncultured Paraglaciecola sp. TaxID=1765024 RepID=UPI0030DD3923|tara:strand:- start:142255 stop:142659 length:405 start_codon:yes stop_codon:yes gene_type:complete
MNNKPNNPNTVIKTTASQKTLLAEQIDKKAKRKLKAQRQSGTSAWFGLGMMGLIGWSIALPTILGATFGIWLDKHYQVAHSWTLALLLAGLTLGCFTAWNWVSKEDKAMREVNEEDIQELNTAHKKQHRESNND